ncbi:MAG: hypothetical protein IT428_32180 [Planctomycetaceae bacterium]|nr:hypothetical protein [Planctomycetaceae bacterium]
MSHRTIQVPFRLLVRGLALTAALAGCNAVEQMSRMPSSSARRAAMHEREETMRHRFVENGDTAAIRWLLANVVDEGMDVEEVGRILGQPGEYVEADNFVKTKDSAYYLDDRTYRWGPDDHGRAYFLVFRDRKLVNYDPAQYGRGE